MSNVEFIKRATAAVVDYFNHHVDVTDNFALARRGYVCCVGVQDIAEP